MTNAQDDVQATEQTASTSDDAMKSKRKKLLGYFALIVIIAAILYAIWAVFFNHSISTDNAYVGAENAQITSMVSGQVAKVLVTDTHKSNKVIFWLKLTIEMQRLLWRRQRLNWQKQNVNINKVQPIVVH
jgi:hypothetical protein